MDMKLEVVVIPVGDVDRARDFYTTLGWRLDADIVDDDGIRLVQLTPPGSPCSIQFGTRLTLAAPGTAQSVYLVVDDIDTAGDELVGRGVEVSPVFHCATGFACRFGDRRRRTACRAPRRAAPTHRSRRSPTPTATAGCSRRSRAACRAVDTAVRRGRPRR